MNCKNCDTILTDTSDFCNDCGAKVIRNRLTIKALFSHFSEEFLSYDNKFLQTFKQLFTKPEAVIGCYINGTRKKYVNVISYFAIAITFSGLLLYILNKFFPEFYDFSSFAEQGTEEFQNNILAFNQEFQSLIMMLYIPFFALLSKIVFFNIKKYNYTELLVIFMYVFAQISIIGVITTLIFAIFGIPYLTLSYILPPLYILYSSYCLKLLYNLDFRRIALKTLFFLLMLIIVFVLFMILFLIVMYFNGSLQEIIEAQKAAKEASGG